MELLISLILQELSGSSTDLAVTLSCLFKYLKPFRFTNILKICFEQALKKRERETLDWARRILDTHTHTV